MLPRSLVPSWLQFSPGRPGSAVAAKVHTWPLTCDDASQGMFEDGIQANFYSAGHKSLNLLDPVLDPVLDRDTARQG